MVTGGLLDCISIAYCDLIVLIAYCSQTFLVYLFIWCAHISYGWFIAIHYKFKLSTYVQELLVIGRWGCVQREIEMRKQLAADNGHKQSSENAVQ